MRIFYVNVIEENVGWGAEYFLNKAFNFMGHTTYCLDYRKNRHILYKNFLRIPESDVFLLQRGDYFPLQLVKAVQVPRFFWNSELVSRCQDNHHLLRSGLFDHIFLRTNACIDTVVGRGWIKREKCSVLLSSFDESVNRQMPNVHKDIDVLFVGTITPRRQRILDKVSNHFDIVIASAYGNEMALLFNRAKIVLNIHAEEFLDTETRVFEVLGCGSFLLTEQLSQENPFSQYELVEFETIEELFEKLHYFLSHDEERNKIARSGHIAATSKHTYIHRAQQIVDIMSACMNEGNEQVETVKRDWKLHAYSMSEPFFRLKILPGQIWSSLSKVKQLVRYNRQSMKGEDK